MFLCGWNSSKSCSALITIMCFAALCSFLLGAKNVNAQSSNDDDKVTSTSDPIKADQALLKFDVSKLPELKDDCLDAVGDEDKINEIVKSLENQFGAEKQSEPMRMLIAILQGSSMGPNEGWFGPARKTYDWEWLAKNQEIELDDALDESEFIGPKDLFTRLDRNSDGLIELTDFDWSMNSNYLREQSFAQGLFRKLDRTQDGQLSKQELDDFFDVARKQKSELTFDDFRRALKLGSRTEGGFFPGDAPSPTQLINGFFDSEIGSHSEGIFPGQTAPNFELSTQDGTKTIELAKVIGEKPVVLIFGNFTCGPYRRNYPEFDQVARRYQDQAHFIGIYVREAHPEDGWIMQSNTNAGVKIAQPKSIGARTKVAQTCATTLNYSIPLLVDTMDDRVGNLYSGMPARAYVIGKDGKVTYQSGRGPFGFIASEMEQALLLTLLSLDSPRL